MLDPIPYWRDYWVAQMLDGKEFPQFSPTGEKLNWNKLPDKPVAITLMPFSKDLALNVRNISKVAALAIANKPIVVKDFGEGGLLCGMDERRHTTPSVKCNTCGHLFPFDPHGKAECPACHAKDDYFCPQCQENKPPIAHQGGGAICPDCLARGRTQGLKRIMKFSIASPTQYDFQRWVRVGKTPADVENILKFVEESNLSEEVKVRIRELLGCIGTVEVRVTQDKIVVQRYKQPGTA